MPSNSLLLAGPVGLDLLDNGSALVGGAGAMAAIAAAAAVPTQIWARVGDDFTEQCRSIISSRRIDDGGLICEGGPSSRYQLSDGQVAESGDSALPEAEPHDPVGVTCAAAIGLKPSDGQRALACFRRLPDADQRIIVAAPAIGPDDGEYLLACAQAADLLVIQAARAQQALGLNDPLATAQRLIDAGATAVALSDGPFGGLWRYKNALGTWAADPQSGKDDRHALAVLAGIVSAQLCEAARLDLRSLKRALATGSAVAGGSIADYGPRRLLSQSRGDYQTLFLRLRRNNKA